MWDAVLWAYMINATLLITHEIDSAYWQEWDLFRLPGGIAGFLIIHVPLIFLILYGLVLVLERSFTGLVLSLVLSLGGIAAFAIHMTFIKLGRPEFKTAVSLCLLVAILVVSVGQAALVVHMFTSG